MELQQKRAWWSLGIGVVMFIAILAIFITKGVSSFFEDLGMRLLVDALLIGGLASYPIILFLTRRRPGQAEVVLDERDEIIAKRAMLLQLWAVIGSLVVWAIVLTEVYWDQGGIPIVFPYLIFFSSLIVNFLAQSAGILLGYWRMGSHAEG